LDIIPALKERGVRDDQIAKMMVENPRNVFESLAKGGC
jgi:predicted metal-dependent phosphotriesterase family hydrolase